MTFKTKKFMIYSILILIVIGLAFGGYWFYKLKQFAYLEVKNYPMHVKKAFPYNYNVGEAEGKSGLEVHFKKANKLSEIRMDSPNNLSYSGEKQTSRAAIYFDDKISTQLELYSLVVKSNQNDKVTIHVDAAHTQFTIGIKNGESIDVALVSHDRENELTVNPSDDPEYEYHHYTLTGKQLVFKLVPHDKRSEKNEWSVEGAGKVPKKIIAE